MNATHARYVFLDALLRELGNVLYSVKHIDSLVITLKEIRYKLTFETLEENRQDIQADYSKLSTVWFVLILQSVRSSVSAAWDCEGGDVSLGIHECVV